MMVVTLSGRLLGRQGTVPLMPRFQPASGARRPFVNREYAFKVFAEELRRKGPGPRVLNITGIGGIGKSRLLRELSKRVLDSHRVAVLDLQVPAWREQEVALAVLRREFGAQGVRFDRYDIAYAALWQRLHPHLRLDRKQLPLIDNSEVLVDIVDGVSGLPIFATAVGLVKLIQKTPKKIQKWRYLHNDPTLQELDNLSNVEMADAVTYLFADDLRRASEGGKHFVVLIDSYEALVAGSLRAGHAVAQDTWLRDLVVQLESGQTVIASREPLSWESYDPDWGQVIRTLALDDLPMSARLELLADGGIADSRQQLAIAEASAGVPFYLNLALDTLQQAAARNVTTAVSPAEILQRFLQHVDSQNVRFLELLSFARTFDYDVFEHLVRKYNLPSGRMVWESLTSYSFVNSSGPRRYQLHELMVMAMQNRLPAEVGVEVHRLLCSLWNARARASELNNSDSDKLGIVTALREAIYHALQAGDIDGEGLVLEVDRILAVGATFGIDGIVSDVEGVLASRGYETVHEGDLAKGLRCLQAEAAIRHGDALAAMELTPDAGAHTFSVVDARLAVAGAHARRILGETSEALQIYTMVWEREDNTQRLVAGLWAADLHMAQGRFAEAVLMANLIRELCGSDESELAGDVNRLLHLAYRFSMDFSAAVRFLDEAERAYSLAESAIGLANIAVNRAELLAWTHPESAISVADKAIVLQKEIGAKHEVGKAYTAIALAETILGEQDRAERALNLAYEALGEAGYRSGLARARLINAIIAIRQGSINSAENLVREAIDEFHQTEVYPTLILLGQALLQLIGRAGSSAEVAVSSARREIHPVGHMKDLEFRMWQQIAAIVGNAGKSLTTLSPELSLYLQSFSGHQPSAGFYNNNVRLDTPRGPVIVRIPLAGADQMDLRILAEDEVLRAVGSYVAKAPRVLYTSTMPEFQIHEYVEGQLLDHIAPRGTAVPDFVIDDVVDLFVQLSTVPWSVIPKLPELWPANGDTVGFARLLSNVTAGVWKRFSDEYRSMYSALGVPLDPLTPALVSWSKLSPRPFRMLHCDVHRKNIIVNRSSASFLDWELALWGDPVYDLAVHLHKMAYQDHERHVLVQRWHQRLPEEITYQWEADLEIYLTHERIKSALVDSVRYAKIVSSAAASPDQQRHLVASLTGKLNAAGVIWGWREKIDSSTVAEVLVRSSDHDGATGKFV